jgi:hypothetical protein
MSAPEKLDTRARLLMYARWATIGLAALFGLIFAVFGGATSLRLAASMAVLAVVVVLISITINGPQSTKVHLEETLLDEIDMLRDDVRADITTAARATHRALAEKVAHLHGDLEHMRRTLDARPLGSVPTGTSAVGAPVQRRAIGPAGPVVHHTETVHVTTHQTYVDPADDVPAERYPQRPAARRPERDDRADYERGRAAETDRVRPDERWDAPRDRRQAAPQDDWSERARARTPMPADPYEDSGEIPARRGSRSRDDDPADDPRWTGMRSGDRWAEVRADDRGRELRMGERRKTVRADETGTQMRIVDRWSSVREPAGYESSYGSRYAEPARYDEAPSGGFRTGPENTGETRSERRRREEAEATAREASAREASAREASARETTARETTAREATAREAEARRGRRSEPEAGRWGAEQRSERARPALPSSGPESAAGWMGREEQDADWRGRSRHEISGEIVRPSRSVPPATEQPWSAPRRLDARTSESRVPERSRVEEPRGRAAEQHGRGEDYRDRAEDHRGRGDERAYGSRADDRWEREPSGGRQPVRPRLDFDGSDDRWR